MSDALHWLVGQLARLGLDYSFVFDAYASGKLLDGALTTLWLCLCGIAGSLLVGVLLAAAVTSTRRWLAWPARAFIEVTRNTPTLVQLYCAFLVLNMLINQSLGSANPMTPFAWVVLVISLHKGAFHAEALRAGIEAVPAVTLEAASSLAFSRRQQLLQVQLPLALRFALPALVNNLIDLVKMTAVASAIAVNDITYAAIMIWTQGDNVIELMILILAFYGLLSLAVNCAGRGLEARLRMPGYGH
ncbi:MULTISPECIES: amino acid ABC transporter permease [Pseudomonas]|jgi:polar amino acid transport system permease protein|uniref:amino acid ABC transporter permease n=1 Tax=Pseudomonas TaxID=286 RepID=UPI0020C47A3C|nr:amino acid ABC transporter permease [Pseudomonas fluorescens]UTL93044.1 amino acid ABC transporter permease [Pseudomonas fluorescens]